MLGEFLTLGLDFIPGNPTVVGDGTPEISLDLSAERHCLESLKIEPNFILEIDSAEGRPDIGPDWLLLFIFFKPGILLS